MQCKTSFQEIIQFAANSDLPVTLTVADVQNLLLPQFQLTTSFMFTFTHRTNPASTFHKLTALGKWASARSD